MSSNNEIKDNSHGDNRFPAPEDNPFNTPDNYFDLLGPRIKDRISSSSQAPIPVGRYELRIGGEDGPLIEQTIVIKEGATTVVASGGY